VSQYEKQYFQGKVGLEKLHNNGAGKVDVRGPVEYRQTGLERCRQRIKFNERLDYLRISTSVSFLFYGDDESG
jgi:hypothetical protein